MSIDSSVTGSGWGTYTRTRMFEVTTFAYSLHRYTAPTYSLHFCQPGIFSFTVTADIHRVQYFLNGCLCFHVVTFTFDRSFTVYYTLRYITHHQCDDLNSDDGIVGLRTYGDRMTRSANCCIKVSRIVVIVSGSGTNLKVGEGHRSGTKKWGHESGAKRRKKFFLVVPSTFLAPKAQLVVLLSAFVIVSTVWLAFCLLFFYSRCPPCPVESALLGLGRG